MNVKIFPLSLHFPVQDPFLFCAHHLDHYPEGDAKLGIKDRSLLKGRQLGSDFGPGGPSSESTFRMYHGTSVPGFPVHPHRGFETVTMVRQGFVDHADSLGAAGRYSTGDVQWMTAGRGIQHSEMFPLVHQDKKNTTELFQIWLNLPKASKLIPPNFKMFWREQVPRVKSSGCEVEIVAGSLEGVSALSAPTGSLAANPKFGVRILHAELDPGATLRLDPTCEGAKTSIYFYNGKDELDLAGARLKPAQGAFLERVGQEESKASIELNNLSASEKAKILVLEGRPIQETVFQHGPFVMNAREEIIKALDDYEKTQFGGWPWKTSDWVHPQSEGRFAITPDKKRLTPPGAT